MTTLHDLKQALDSGETITDGVAIIYKSIDNSRYIFHGSVITSELTWDKVKDLISPDIWRIRDQIGADPAMMAVPIDEWNALQEELKKAREIPPFIQQVLSIQNETIDGFVTWMDGLTEVDKIFLLNAWLHIRQYMNNDAREWEQIRKRIYP
jgi:hypothetical protein